MEKYIVRVTGDRDFCFVPNGHMVLSARCTKQSDGKYLFEYHYLAYKKGGGDTEKVEKVAKAILTLGKTQSLSITNLKWEYIKGCYNQIGRIDVTLLTPDQALKYIKKEPSYVYGYTLLALEKHDDFVNSLLEVKEPEDDEWSIYSNNNYEMLTLAYTYGVGREKDERKALLNALRCINYYVAIPFIERGFAEKTIKNAAFLEEETQGIHSKADDYLLGNALIEEGFVSAGEKRILWGADCICYDYPEFYEKGNEKAIHYQSLIHKQAAEILFKNKDKKELIMENYGTYLAYVKYGDDRKVHYKETVNLGDGYESDWQEREAVNHALIKNLIQEAADNGDEFAKNILAL